MLSEVQELRRRASQPGARDQVPELMVGRTPNHGLATQSLPPCPDAIICMRASSRTRLAASFFNELIDPYGLGQQLLPNSLTIDLSDEVPDVDICEIKNEKDFAHLLRRSNFQRLDLRQQGSNFVQDMKRPLLGQMVMRFMARTVFYDCHHGSKSLLSAALEFY